MKKYTKLIRISAFVLIVLTAFLFGEDMAGGFRERYSSVPE